MNRYYPNTACIKCGCRESTTKYYSHMSEYANQLVIYDYLLRTCCRCGFEWREYPLDHKEKSDDPTNPS